MGCGARHAGGLHRRLAAWNTQWHRRGRKVGDRALVNASDGTHGHLHIYILGEPDAHQVARMQPKFTISSC